MFEDKELSIKDKIVKIIKYLNDNATALSIVSAVSIAIVANLLKILVYVYYSGWFKYFKINRIYIDISDKNIFYSIATSISVCIIYFALNYVVYKIIAFRNKKIKHLLKPFIIIGFINVVYLLLGTNYIFRISDILAMFIVCFIILPILEYLVGISWGVIELIMNTGVKKTKKIICVQENKVVDTNNYNKSNKIIYKSIFKFIYLMVIAFSIYVLMFFEIGNWNAKKTTSFKIINNQGVILYETENEYLVAECNIISDTDTLIINKNIQTYIDKTDVRTEYMEFISVKYIQTN